MSHLEVFPVLVDIYERVSLIMKGVLVKRLLSIRKLKLSFMLYPDFAEVSITKI